MRFTPLRTLQLAGLCAIAAPALANPVSAEPQQIRLVVQGGFTFGGDNLSTVQTKYGDDKIKAGSLFQGGAGILAQAGTLPLAAQLTYNYHVAGTSYTNGKTSFHRTPLELTFYYTGVENWRFGAGLRDAGKAKHKMAIDGSPTLRGTLQADTGLILEAGRAIGSSLWISGRFVKETYKLQDYSVGSAQYDGKNQEFDGSHAGMFVTFAF